MATTPDDVRTQLTGPGGAFEVGIESIDGIDTKMYRQRFGSLREVAAMAGAYGDREALVFGDQRFTYGQVIAWANRVANGLVEHHAIKRVGRCRARWSERLVDSRRSPVRARTLRGTGSGGRCASL